MDKETFLRAALDNVAGSGRHIQGVGPGEGKPAFCYTAGNCEKGYPELLLIGNFDPRIIAQVLNQMSDDMIENQARPEGKVLPWPDSEYPVLARAVTDPAMVRDKYTLLVDDILCIKEYDIIQIVLCDPTGKFPGDEGIEPYFDITLV